VKAGFWVMGLAALAAAALAWYGYGRWYGSSPHEEHAKPASEKKILYYHCPMHPEYKSDKPGSCPVCGMHLEPVHAGAPSEVPPGGAILTPQQQQRYGIVVGQPAFETVELTIRALGVVQPDETRIVRVHSKVEGWIEEVQADFTGRHVKRGEPLVSVYSPELLASQQEYLLALRARNVIEASTVPGQRGGGESLAQAARRRLELWDLPPEAIEEIARTGQILRTVPILSPADGYVMARNAYRRQRITPETELYRLADLSRVWVMADIFESDQGSLRLGQSAVVRLAYAASRSFPAKVHYIQPAADPATRTLKVRLEVDNPRMELKPDMYVNVEIRAGGGRGLFVPSDAVLDTGLAKRVFVVHTDGHFEPREVETGREWNGKVEIVRGLSAQDRIVTSGVFLVDSESRLRAGGAGRGHDQPAH